MLELGCTPDIAALLRSFGVRGRRDETCGCALAVFIREQCGREYAEVTYEYTSVSIPGTYVMDSEDNPRNVQRFIEAFDAGEYPELELPNDADCNA